MKFLYEFFSKRSSDEAAAKRKYKTVNILIYSVLLCAAGFVTYSYVSQTGFGGGSVILIGADCFFIFCIIREILDKYTYLHRSHLKEYGEVLEKYGGKLEIIDPYGKRIFKCTLNNDSSVEGGYDGEKYVFTVKNDEWDAVGVYTAYSDDDHIASLSEALEHANSLEKLPEGEYDESLAPAEEEGGEDVDQYDDEEDEDEDEDDEDEDEEDDD